ncbi:hypothetical protein F5B22DRAFT_567960 [Xylaria bambusicola]|uniref:uncharacterized protein n=1 Tax=Xylaria bambusicola TaxID=326684 RepID=UPI00200892C2|nr:uncharacterized protein F5B22DRAFT_567960 [Xylaria bambusicola]KAI0521267.1 hypothetical protein F5B22DRAFT_567960 [Xylaria bambusicola]
MNLNYHIPPLLRIGTDICYIPRIRKILRGKFATPFIHRILHPEEIDYPPTANILGACKNPADGSITFNAVGEGFKRSGDSVKFYRAVEFMAGRFAAKEAVTKAHPPFHLTFKRIQIIRESAFLDYKDPNYIDPIKLGLKEASTDTKKKKKKKTDTEKGKKTDKPKEMTPKEMIKKEMEAEDEEGYYYFRRHEIQGGAVIAVIHLLTEPAVLASVSISHDTNYASAACIASYRF